MKFGQFTCLFLSICSLLLSPLLISGCGGESSGGNAKKQRILVYTAIESEQIPQLLAAFEAKHPQIRVDRLRDSTGIITSRILAEADNPQADVIWGLAATSLLLCDEAGLLAPYAPAGLQNIAPQFRDKRPTPHWIGTGIWMTAISANTAVLGDRNLPIPRSLEDLTRPQYRNMVTMPNPGSSGTGFLTVSAILQMKGEEQGWVFLDRLHQNVAEYVHSGSKPAKLAAQGEYAIGVSFGFRGIMEQDKGAPLEVIFPEEGSGWDLEASALVQKDEISDAAKTFLDWAISRQAMELYNEHYAIVSHEAVNKVPEGFPDNPKAQLIDNDFAWAATNRQRILKQWNQRYSREDAPK